MNREALYYLIPYIISLVGLTGLIVYALRQRYIRGTRQFAWIVGGQIVTSLGFIFELVSTDLDTKVLWDTFQWLTTAFLVILPFLMFAVQFSEHKLPSASLIWGLLLIFLIIFAAFLVTDRVHHQFYSNLRLTTVGPFSELTYDFTWPAYLYLLFYVYGMNLYAITLLIKRAFQPSGTFHGQYLIVASGYLIPIAFSLLVLTGIQILPQQDLMPLAYSVGILIVAWGLFRYGLFDIIPLARDQLFENVGEPVIVLDRRNRITDINKAALALIGKQSSDVIGQTSNVALAPWGSLSAVISNPFVQKKEVSIVSEGKTLFFEVNISPIFGQDQELVGRLLTARDITRLRTLEVDFHTLSKNMEQHIQSRVEELKNTAERYRTIVENHSDFIVRWKPDGTRTFVNEAYCRYWGITSEEALARNFLFHTSAEDRPGIEEKISRFDSGDTEIETEMYQVTRPDGSIVWHEWIDQAIRDQWGKLIEIQSTGRDITARRQEEEKPGY